MPRACGPPVAARSPEVAVHVQLSRLLASQVACDQIRFGRVDEAAAVVLEGVQAWLERLGARRISATRRTQELIMRWMGQPNLDRSRDEYDHGLLLAHILSLPVQPQLKDKSLVRGNLLFGSLVGSLWDRGIQLVIADLPCDRSAVLVGRAAAKSAA